MGKVDGLIIPRSYNDYFSRSETTQFNDAVKATTDDELDTTSENPIQNKVVAEAINDINEVIPAQASSSNKLADKDFVNSSVGTNTANYISNNGEPFTSVEALEAYAGTVTNNDYAFVTGTDSAGNTYYDRYKATVSGATVTWAKEYRLNNSSFTAAQWSAIESGITAAKVAIYDQFAAGALPVGVVLPFLGASAPSASWLVCDGSAFDETVYPELYQFLGNSNVLPDMRELALVGAGKNTTHIFDSTETNPSTQQAGTQKHDVFTVGQFKDDELKGHHHTLYGRNSGGGSSMSNSYPITTHGIIGHASSSIDYVEATTAGSSTHNLIGDTGGDVTRGKRMGVNYIIKAKP